MDENRQLALHVIHGFQRKEKNRKNVDSRCDGEEGRSNYPLQPGTVTRTTVDFRVGILGA